MSQEIIYTSAPKGLKPGSRGFCTVVSTAGMAKNLAERLETLSGYRHQFMPHEAGENPVNFSHVKLTVGGKKYHVLSRICDAGLDYTKRTNKLAHHIAFTTSEVAMCPGGPAWAMSQDKFLIEVWNGEVKTVAESIRKLAATPCPLGICQTWAALGVDAGWAGELAESAIKKTQPMTVIFKGGTDTLSLVREALALVPAGKRWDVTFSTFFTKLPAGVDCLWRFVLDDTQEAATLRRNPHARVIDLCDPSLGQPRESELVTLARTGKSQQKAAASPVAKESTATARRVGNTSNTPPVMAPPVGHSATPGSVVLGDPLQDGGAPMILKPEPGFADQRSQSWRKIGLVAALLILVVGGMLGAYYAGTRTNQIADVSIPDNNLNGEPKPAPEPVPEAKPKKPDYNPEDLIPEKDKQAQDNAKAEAEEKARREKQAQERAKAAEQAAMKKGDAEKTEPEPIKMKLDRKPFEDLQAKDFKLKLPPRPTKAKSFNPNAAKLEFVALANLYVNNVEDCQLALRGEEAEERNEIEFKPENKDGTIVWKIVPKTSVIGLRSAAESGTFQLVNQSLQFKWGKSPQLDLRLCLLDVTVGDQTETCELAIPEKVAPIQVRFDDGENIANLNLGQSDANKKLKIWLTGVGDPAVNQKSGMGFGDKALFTIPFPQDLRNKKEIEIAVEFDKQGLIFETFAYARMIVPDDPDVFVVRKGADAGNRQPKPRQIKTEALCQVVSREWIHKQLLSCSTMLTRIEKAEGRRAQLQGQLESPGGKQELANAIRQASETIKRNGLLPEKRKREEIEKIRDQYAKRYEDRRVWRKEEAQRLVKYKELVLENQKWCEDLQALMEKIHNDGRVHFRAYAVSDDREIDLYTTE